MIERSVMGAMFVDALVVHCILGPVPQNSAHFINVKYGQTPKCKRCLAMKVKRNEISSSWSVTHLGDCYPG